MKLKLGAVLALTAVCLVWALWGIDPAMVQVSLTGMRVWLIPVVLLGYALTHVLRSFRLQALLGPHVSFWSLFSINAVGFLAINVVPLRLGEFVRPYLLLEKHRVPFGSSLAAVFLERLCDVLALATMLLLVAFAVDLPPGGIVVGGLDVIDAGRKMAGTLLGGGVLFIAVLTIGGPPVISRVSGLLQKLPVVGHALPGFLLSFVEGLRGLFVRPGRAVVVAVCTIGMWAATIAACGACLAAFDGLPVSWESALTTWTITLTGMTVAPTPGFFGAFEAFCVAALMLWKVDQAIAATFAVVLHLTQFGFSVALGGGFMLKEGLSLGQVVEQSRKAATT